MVKNFNLMFCHRDPNRSFFFKGKQFPFCARCTGVFVGQLIAILLILSGVRPILNAKNLFLILFLMSTMFFDWFIQYMGYKESTNIRRLITGVLGGAGVIFVYYLALSYLIRINC